MASESGSALFRCFLCETMHKWFKMMISANPASLKEAGEWPDNVSLFRTDGTTEVLSSGGTDEALYAAVESLSLTEADRGSKPASSVPGRGILYMKVCQKCELQWREEVAAAHHEYPEWAQWADKQRVNLDHKKAAKGPNWVARGQLYLAARVLCEEARDASDSKITKKQLAAMKTAKCKELVEAFNAFANAQDSEILHAKLQEDVQEKYEAYLQSRKLLRALGSNVAPRPGPCATRGKRPRGILKDEALTLAEINLSAKAARWPELSWCREEGAQHNARAARAPKAAAKAARAARPARMEALVEQVQHPLLWLWLGLPEDVPAGADRPMHAGRLLANLGICGQLSRSCGDRQHQRRGW